MDTDRLIACVQAKPAIYNHHFKEHSNKIIINQLWEEIGKELECSASDCRLKWHNLRSSYSRYVRTKRNMPSGTSCSKRKKWYLADAMSFLDNHLNQHNKSVGSIVVKEETRSGSEVDEFLSENAIVSQSSSSLDSRPSTKEKRKTGTEMLAVPMQKFLESREHESQMLYFFKGLLPDIEKLSVRRQRTFKVKLLEILNHLADEEEAEEILQS